MTRDATRGGQKSAQLSEADDFEAIMTAWAAELRTKAALVECLGQTHVDTGRLTLQQARRLAATLDQLARLHDAPTRAVAAEAALGEARRRFERAEASVLRFCGWAVWGPLVVYCIVDILGLLP